MTRSDHQYTMLLVILASVSVLEFSIEAEIVDTYYSGIDSLTDMYDQTVVVWSATARDLVDCSSMCTSDSNCLSFFFNTNTGMCSAVDVALNGPSGSTVSQVNTLYFADSEAAAAASSHGGMCPDTYTWHSPLSFCFRISTDTLIWTAAQDRCVSEGGHLFDAKDVNEHNHVKGILTSGIHFVGGRDDVTEDSWYWTDGSPFTYAPWYEGQPNNIGEQDCLILEPSCAFDFSDGGCGSAYNYICEVDVVNCLPPYTYEPNVGVCYRLGTESYTWQTANDQCTSEGGHLIHLKTAAIHTFIKSVCTTAGGGIYYIGGKDDIVEGTFRWTDGTLMDYASWGSGQPNNLNDQDCLIIESAYGYDMSDITCTSAYKYICEI